MTSSRLRAGAGRALITPPVGFPMGGWSNALQDRSQGNDMDLTATVLLVTDGTTTVALAELDLCLITDAQAAAMRGAIGEAVGIPGGGRASDRHSQPLGARHRGADRSGLDVRGARRDRPVHDDGRRESGRGGADSVGRTSSR